MEANAAKRKAWSAVASLWDDEIAFLQDLVRRPSTRGETNLVQRFIAETLRDMGLEVAEPGIDLGQIAGQPGFSPPEWSYEGLINVVGKAPAAAQGGRSLIFNGHIDVVSAEPLGHWSHNPWGGDIVKGRMYGRGAADMKSGVAAMIYALKAVHEAEAKLRGDVLIESVIDEECTGNGTLSCLAQGYRADAAVIPEPTHLSLVTAQTADPCGRNPVET